MTDTSLMTEREQRAYRSGYNAYAAQPGNPYHEDDRRYAAFYQGQRDGMAAHEEYVAEMESDERLSRAQSDYYGDRY